MRSTAVWLAPIALAIFFGVAPGCGGDDLDLATRIVNVTSRSQQVECNCDVESGDYASHAECVDVENIAEPVPDTGCVAEAIAQHPDDLPALECQIGHFENLIDCLSGASCSAEPVQCRPSFEALDQCPQGSDSFEDALDACRFPDASDLANRLVRSRDRSNDALCACATTGPTPAECRAAVDTYVAPCLAVLGGSQEIKKAIACELKGYAEYYACLREPGFCGNSLCAADLSSERGGGFFCDDVTDRALAGIETCDTSYVPPPPPPPTYDACVPANNPAGSRVAGMLTDEIQVFDLDLGGQAPGEYWVWIDLSVLDTLLAWIQDPANNAPAIAEAVVPALILLDGSFRDACNVPGILTLHIIRAPGSGPPPLAAWAQNILDFLNILRGLATTINELAVEAAAQAQCVLVSEFVSPIFALLMGCDI